MFEVWQLSQWLKEGGKKEAAELIEQCTLEFIYADTMFEIGGEREFDMFDIQIAAPRRILDDIKRFSKQIEDIKETIQEFAHTAQCVIRNISWVPLIPSRREIPIESGVIESFSELNSDHIHSLWQKALDRKKLDPDGAITVARSLIESVCKLILDDSKIDCSKSAELPKLYHLTAEVLALGPDQHSHRLMKNALGNAQGVVNSLAAIRNYLGDAHGKSDDSLRIESAHAELAVNLAGSIATFLTSVWKQKKETES